MLFLPQNFRCFSNSSKFFNFYTFCQVKTTDLISGSAFPSYMHITFFGFPLIRSHLLQKSSFFSLAQCQGAAVWMEDYLGSQTLVAIPTQLMAQPCCWAAGLIQIEVLQAKPQTHGLVQIKVLQDNLQLLTSALTHLLYYEASG